MVRSSVSRRISWHTETYWAERGWQILNKRELSKISSSILNYLLRLIEVHYFNMNTDEKSISELLAIRFPTIIFLFRLAGIPVKLKKLSTTYILYMITVIICNCSMFIGMFLDVYVHWDDLGRAMTTIRAFISFANYMWIFSTCR